MKVPKFIKSTGRFIERHIFETLLAMVLAYCGYYQIAIPSQAAYALAAVAVQRGLNSEEQIQDLVLNYAQATLDPESDLDPMLRVMNYRTPQGMKRVVPADYSDSLVPTRYGGYGQNLNQQNGSNPRLSYWNRKHQMMMPSKFSVGAADLSGRSVYVGGDSVYRDDFSDPMDASLYTYETYDPDPMDTSTSAATLINPDSDGLDAVERMELRDDSPEMDIPFGGFVEPPMPSQMKMSRSRNGTPAPTRNPYNVVSRTLHGVDSELLNNRKAGLRHLPSFPKTELEIRRNPNLHRLPKYLRSSPATVAANNDDIVRRFGIPSSLNPSPNPRSFSARTVDSDDFNRAIERGMVMKPILRRSPKVSVRTVHSNGSSRSSSSSTSSYPSVRSSRTSKRSLSIRNLQPSPSSSSQFSWISKSSKAGPYRSPPPSSTSSHPSTPTTRSSRSRSYERPSRASSSSSRTGTDTRLARMMANSNWSYTKRDYQQPYNKPARPSSKSSSSAYYTAASQPRSSSTYYSASSEPRVRFARTPPPRSIGRSPSTVGSDLSGSQFYYWKQRYPGPLNYGKDPSNRNRRYIAPKTRFSTVYRKRKPKGYASDLTVESDGRRVRLRQKDNKTIRF